MGFQQNMILFRKNFAIFCIPSNEFFPAKQINAKFRERSEHFYKFSRNCRIFFPLKFRIVFAVFRKIHFREISMIYTMKKKLTGMRNTKKKFAKFRTFSLKFSFAGNHKCDQYSCHFESTRPNIDAFTF